MRLIEPAIFRSAYRSFTASWTETKMISEKKGTKIKVSSEIFIGSFCAQAIISFLFSKQLDNFSTFVALSNGLQSLKIMNSFFLKLFKTPFRSIALRLCPYFYPRILQGSYKRCLFFSLLVWVTLNVFYYPWPNGSVFDEIT